MHVGLERERERPTDERAQQCWARASPEEARRGLVALKKVNIPLSTRDVAAFDLMGFARIGVARPAGLAYGPDHFNPVSRWGAH